MLIRDAGIVDEVSITAREAEVLKSVVGSADGLYLDGRFRAVAASLVRKRLVVREGGDFPVYRATRLGRAVHARVMAEER